MDKDECSRYVCCEVENCKYHGYDCKCHADSITVESPSAMRKGETYCGTFSPNGAFNG